MKGPILGRVSYQDGSTSEVEPLGIPLNETYSNPAETYARNPWDLQVFDGRIYIGGGNSSNTGPSRNAGPVPVISYDPASGSFSEEMVVDDEQIDRFKILEGSLIIPGHDPRESWDWGNYYRLSHDKWEKIRNIPTAIHTYDMVDYQDTLFAGLGLKGGSAVAASSDHGQTWTLLPTQGFRIYTLLEVSGQLYATDLFPASRIRETYLLLRNQPRENWPPILRLSRDPASETASVSEFKQGKMSSRPDLDAETLFPGLKVPEDRWAKIYRTCRMGEATVYIGGWIHNDHQALPFGVYVAHSLDAGSVRVEPIPLPSGHRPWDILYRERVLYVLTDSASGRGRRVCVFQSRDLKKLGLLLSFESTTFARSFERLNGAFYFGLGAEWMDPEAAESNQEVLPESVGLILRVAGSKK